jgi:hypothetical protein
LLRLPASAASMKSFQAAYSMARTHIGLDISEIAALSLPA